MRLGLGIDGGGTGCRWCLADASGAVFARGAAGPLSGHLFDDAKRAQADATLATIARAAAASGEPGAVVAGVTGLGRDSDAGRHLARMLARHFNLPAARIAVENDMAIAYRAAFEPGAGILIYGGTGSIGFHLAEDGGAIRVGGHGMLLDDGGSGFWIAAAALRAILRAEDVRAGDGWTTPLGRALAGAIGDTEWNAVREFVYGGDRGRVGALARIVLETADPVARDLARRAGQELARLALVMTSRVGTLLIGLTGGVTRAASVQASFRAALPGRDVRVVEIDAALQGALLAARGEGE